MFIRQVERGIERFGGSSGLFCCGWKDVDKTSAYVPMCILPRFY
ncbi:hypothetical protein Hanom_Chr16g01428101 [Helianthus anomalus]